MTPPGTDLAATGVSEEQALEAANAVGAELAAAQAQEYGDEPLQTPILKIGQGLTAEVQAGDAAVGEFIDTLSGEGLGTTVDFIIGYYNQGRFASDDDGNAFVAFDRTIPESWEPLVGPDYVGTPFSEYPEAEEVFKAAVNSKEREWGSGPLVSTTHNYTGIVVIDHGDDDIEYRPARLSLKRIDMPAHRKLQTLLRAVLRNKSPWDAVVRLSTSPKDFGRNTAYTIKPTDVKIVRDTEPLEKLQASEVALAARQGRTVSEGAEDALTDAPAKPDGNDGLGV